MSCIKWYRVLALLVLLWAGATSAVAHAEDPACGRGKIAGSIGCGGSAGRGRNDHPQTIQSGPPTTAYPFQELWRPVLSQDAVGVACLDTERVRLGREPSALEEANSAVQFLGLMRLFRICADAAPLPTTTPAMEAASFLRQISLPVPLPYVEPGSLPVGFEAYLETGAPTSQTFGPVDTPFGPLVLTATAQIYVDWADPHDDVAGEHGPYTGQPGPYPEGDIKHVYQHHGVYDIDVRYVWTANWSIGDVSGTIDGAETEGSYPDPGFEAYSREAVGR